MDQTGGSPYTEPGRTIDRWRFHSDSNGVLTIGSGYLAIRANADSDYHWYQLVEASRITAGKTYTFAMQTTDGEIAVGSAVLSSGMTAVSVSNTFTTGQTVRMRIGYYASIDAYRVMISGDHTDDVLMKWAAFYEGEYTAETLPEYVPKGYPAELALCQRYYYRLTTPSTTFPYGYGYCYGTTQGRIALPIPQPMRLTNPDFTYTAGTYFRLVMNGEYRNITTLTLNRLVGSCALLSAAAENLTGNTPVVLTLAGSVLEFDADLHT